MSATATPSDRVEARRPRGRHARREAGPGRGRRSARWPDEPDGVEWHSGMDAVRGYGWLCGGVGVLFLAVGLALYAGFFRFHAPCGPGSGPMPMGPNGYYFVRFAGTGLVALGIALLRSPRPPAL